MFSRIFLITALIVTGTLFAPPPPAHAGILEFFFPSLRDEGLEPSRTLQAPFANQDTTPVDIQKSVDSAVPLNQPHRAASIISKWITVTVSDIMNFNTGDYKQTLESTKHLFDAGGRAQYEAFLTDTKIMNVLESGRYEIHSYVSDIPVLLNEGEINGRYRWLYQVPVTLSYIPRGKKDYKKLEPLNQDVIINLQVGRAEQAETDLHILIETWSGKAQKLNKK